MRVLTEAEDVICWHGPVGLAEQVRNTVPLLDPLGAGQVQRTGSASVDCMAGATVLGKKSLSTLRLRASIERRRWIAYPSDLRPPTEHDYQKEHTGGENQSAHRKTLHIELISVA